MELYSSPMSCSLASHIIALEAGLPVRVHYVDRKTKKTEDGRDFLEIAPGGYVPALRLEHGLVLNEGASVLQYLADLNPETKLAPAWGTAERYQLIDALHYLATEVHQRLFNPIFSASAPDAEKARAMAGLDAALAGIAVRLGERQFLVGESFSAADAYLVTLLIWFGHLGCDLTRWPTVGAYQKRHLARPAVQQAIAQEMEKWQKAQNASRLE